MPKQRWAKNLQHGTVMVLLAVVLVVSMLAAVRIGTTDISTTQLLTALRHPQATGATHDIIWFVRLPRTLLAAAVGCALSVAGVVMQAVVKNPLADPYVLGISSGASLGATLAVMLGLGSVFAGNAVGIFAFIGALAVSFVVQLIANIGGRADAVRLLLAGMALSTVCQAFTSMIIYLSNNAHGLQQVTFWLMGSVAGAKWENLAVIIPAVLVLTIFFSTQARVLNLMLLGDDTATTLGIDVPKFRQLYLTLCALLVGLAVYAAGTIGFVGLVVPHLVRMLSGTDHAHSTIYAALGGAIFLVWADIAARVVLPDGELPIGILISLVGAPVFIWLLLRHAYGFGETK